MACYARVGLSSLADPVKVHCSSTYAPEAQSHEPMPAPSSSAVMTVLADLLVTAQHHASDRVNPSALQQASSLLWKQQCCSRYESYSVDLGHQVSPHAIQALADVMPHLSDRTRERCHAVLDTPSSRSAKAEALQQVVEVLTKARSNLLEMKAQEETASRGDTISGPLGTHPVTEAKPTQMTQEQRALTRSPLHGHAAAVMPQHISPVQQVEQRLAHAAATPYVRGPPGTWTLGSETGATERGAPQIPKQFRPVDRRSGQDASLLTGACPLPLQSRSEQCGWQHAQRHGAPQQREKAPMWTPTLSCTLRLLSAYDPDYIFIIRRINKLGFATKAKRKIAKHFSRYGEVVDVLVAHSTISPARAMKGHLFSPPAGHPVVDVNMKSSSLGFVRMASKGAVASVVAEGPEHHIADVAIRVQKFVHVEPADSESFV